jgi:hypothetical protein
VGGACALAAKLMEAGRPPPASNLYVLN